jgi:hypothetical protein
MFNEQYLAALEQGYKRSQPQKKKTSGRGGFLSSLISELGGAGGAAGGAAAGAAAGSVIPGLGTVIGGLIGAGIGGFGGGTVGRGIENKVRDNQNFFGKGGSAKAAFGEGALSGALSAAIPGAGVAFRGAGKALKGASAIDKLAQESGTVLRQAPKTGILQGAGEQLKAGAGGYGIGARLGSNRLSAQESANVAKSLKQLGVNASSPENMAKQLGAAKSNLESILQKQYADANIRVPKTSLASLTKKINQRIVNEVGTPDAKFINGRLAALRGSKDLTGVWDFNKNLSKFTNYGANAEGKLVDREAAARIMKEETRKFLNAQAKGVKATNDLYHGASTAEQLALNNAADMKGGGAVSKLLNLSPVRASEAKLGGALEGLGKASAGTGGPLTKITQQAKFQAPGNLAEAVTTPPPEQTGITPGADTGFGQDQSGGFGNMQDPYAQPQQQQQSPYSLEAMLSDIQRDPKHASTYQSIYKTVQDAIGSQGGANVGKVSAQAYGLAQQGMNALGQFAQLIQQDPGVVNRTATPGRGLPGVGGFISNATGTSEYDTLGFAAISSLLRAQSGAAVPDSEVRSYMRAYLPRPGDSQEAIQRKLATLQYDFQTVLQGAGGQPQGNDLASLLSQYQTQGAY